MTNVMKKVTGYRAYLFPASPNFEAEIDIDCEDGYGLDIGFLEKPIPVNQFYPDGADGNLGHAYGEISQYPYYIDLLRNEGPLYAFFIIDSTPPEFAVGTEMEGIREGEIADTINRISRILARKTLAGNP